MPNPSDLWFRRIMTSIGYCWSAYWLAVPRGDSFGFYADDIPYLLLFWGMAGWPGQLMVFLFTAGSANRKLKAAVISFFGAFLLGNMWMKADEIAFIAMNPRSEMESYSRPRWFPFSQFDLVKDGDEEWGYGYWAS